MTGHATIIELELPAVIVFGVAIVFIAFIGVIVFEIIDAWKRKTTIK